MPYPCARLSPPAPLICEFAKELVEGLFNSLRAEPDTGPSREALCLHSNYD